MGRLIVIDGLDLGNTSKEDLDTIAEYVEKLLKEVE